MKKVWKVFAGITIAGVLMVALAVGYLLKQYGPNFGIYISKPTPEEYVRQVVQMIDTQAIYADTEEWREKRAETLENAKSANSYEETYDMLDQALKVGGGKHSRLVRPEEEYGTEVQMPSYYMEEEVFVVKLPEFTGNLTQGQEYADMVCNALREYQDEIKGVIVDLRDNCGGDMGPMIAAVSPVLPDGELMYFNIHGKVNPVTLQTGSVNGGGSTMTVENAFKLEGIPVAVLQNELTASSGEATLLCFRGLDYVKSFGMPSAGYCSCNNVRNLYDDAMVLVTMGKDVDRTGKVFCEDPIAPDVESQNPLHDAMEWILVGN